MYTVDNYDVIVIGGGHAGCEAALAAARMGHRTLMATISLDNIALMPCNPAVGGPGKSHLVYEVDALGGQMGINADATAIQMRMLNMGKGPAVHSLRCQSDKIKYQHLMKQTVRRSCKTRRHCPAAPARSPRASVPGAAASRRGCPPAG